jgi:GrpB-like predicted nucleotidyltransferase (UPF0157 family)
LLRVFNPESGASTFIVAHDPAWQREGEALASDLHAALAPLALRVDHIGSTCIPGMAAKPVLDLQVSVADLDAAAPAFDKPLAALGFTRRPYEQDHVPAGRDDPPHRWAKRYWNKRNAGEQHVSLHCRLAGSPNERLALLFRDWFRTHHRPCRRMRGSRVLWPPPSTTWTSTRTSKIRWSTSS